MKFSSGAEYELPVKKFLNQEIQDLGLPQQSLNLHNLFPCTLFKPLGHRLGIMKLILHLNGGL